MSNTPNFTPPPWRYGNHIGTIIADSIVSPRDTNDAQGYYGGPLVAESIDVKNMPVIKAAPELYFALEEAIPKLKAGITPKESLRLALKFQLLLEGIDKEG